MNKWIKSCGLLTKIKKYMSKLINIIPYEVQNQSFISHYTPMGICDNLEKICNAKKTI
jgi:hypothetical protein